MASQQCAAPYVPYAAPPSYNVACTGYPCCPPQCYSVLLLCCSTMLGVAVLPYGVALPYRAPNDALPYCSTGLLYCPTGLLCCPGILSCSRTSNRAITCPCCTLTHVRRRPTGNLVPKYLHSGLGHQGPPMVPGTWQCSACTRMLWVPVWL